MAKELLWSEDGEKDFKDINDFIKGEIKMDIHEIKADINYFVKRLVGKIEELEDENGYLKRQIEKLNEQLGGNANANI